MNLLFDHFEKLIDAQNGIPKMRELILQLAVQGELVPQDPNDEPASKLLKKIKTETQKLIAEGKIKKNHASGRAGKPLPPIKPEEIPYELPKGWVWCRLKALGQVNPRNDINDEVEVSFIPMALISEQYGRSPKSEKRLWLQVKKGFTHFKDDDVVVAKITPCFQNGKSAIMKNLYNSFGAGTTELHVFRGNPEFVLPEYIYIFFKSPRFLEEGVNNMTGTAGQQRVPKQYVFDSPFPFPPINEQHRIVAKVDQLMVLCDELETLKEKRNRKQLLMNKAALFALLNSQTPAEFAQHWQRIVDHFDEFYRIPENVAELKKAILQLAVQGKLVPQDESDEPAVELIKKIKAEKQKLITEGKIKNDKPLPPIKPEEIPYELSKGWVWCRMIDITQKIGSGSTPKGGRSVYTNQGVKFIRSQNVWNNGLKIQGVAFISNDINKIMSGTIVKPKDILLNITGASIGRSCVVPGDFDIGNVNQHVSIIRMINTNLRKWIHTCLISPYFQKLIMDVQVGMSREGLSKAKIERFIIPMPPPDEQKRIVAKVDELMGLCEKLEKGLMKSSETLGKALGSVVSGMG